MFINAGGSKLVYNIEEKEDGMLKRVLLLGAAVLPVFADGPVLKTGQTAVYQTGDDGTYRAGIVRAFTRDDGSGIVTDNATGLQWQDNDVSGTSWGEFDFTMVSPLLAPFSEVQNYCASLNLNGAGWRVPNRAELQSLVERSRSAPAIDPAFNNYVSAHYWSSTPYMPDTSRVWTVDFEIGGNGAADMEGAANFVRCVRGSEAAGSTYVRDETLQTVYDEQTKLTWQDNTVQVASWSGAVAYCETLDFAEAQDWRLPNVNELLSIVDLTKNHPAIDGTAFSITSSQYYWASTSSVYPDTGYAWRVSFDNGYTSYWGKGSYWYVRCVRGGEGVMPNASLVPILMYLLN